MINITIYIIVEYITYFIYYIVKICKLLFYQINKIL